MTEKKEEFNWEYVIPFEKVISGDDGRRIIAGYASNDGVDGDDEVMDMESLKNASDEYFKNPVVRFMHNKSTIMQGAIGKVIPEYTTADGTVLKTQFGEKPFLVIEISKSPVVDPIWKMIEEGMYKGLSIGGKALKKVKEFNKEIGKAVNRIFVQSWIETSVVDTPSAKGSFFNVVKMQGETSEPEPEKITKKVDIRPILDKVDRFERVMNDIHAGSSRFMTK